MPIYERGEARINYTVSGEGFPVLLIAPGGMKSTIAAWETMPWNPLEALVSDYQVIAMDQRNAGGSTAPISAADSWDTYTQDQMGLLDHLGVDRFHLVGMCIGGPYIMGLLKLAPERAASAVMLQPIGLDNNRQAFYDMFDAWATELASQHPEASGEVLASFRSNMYDGDFLFNTTREEVAACQTPLLLLMGNDLYHPQSTSREIAGLAPDVTFVEQWKDEASLPATNQTILDFLATHS